MYLRLVTRMQTLGWDLEKKLRDQKGQTSSEYLVIAGVVVLAVLAVMTAFRGQIKTAFSTLGTKIQSAFR